eukprot:CAMPEP_0198152998 /NCGR_PEP_ID=MMETSP1443-20131203/62150_1 /TAXON_ID=186043 /ORGANISM="Entomoneis sp., Strain CCMP2396" /LENGTH=110 /DNA_ID=CAMNT_0043819169 /DNA_START=68 /DNA_END=398 /DNA_ORIENTATION=+
MSSGNDTDLAPEAAPAESVHEDDSPIALNHLNHVTKSTGNSKAFNTRLSVVSQNYDQGEKGYLTESENQIRSLDTGNKGYLTNAQVAQVAEQTMDMRDDNNSLRNWVLGL